MIKQEFCWADNADAESVAPIVAAQSRSRPVAAVQLDHRTGGDDDGGNASQQGICGNRLDQEFVDTEAFRLDHEIALAIAAQHDDRQVGIGEHAGRAHDPYEVEAVQQRHVPIENDHIGRGAADRIKRRHAVGRLERRRSPHVNSRSLTIFRMKALSSTISTLRDRSRLLMSSFRPPLITELLAGRTKLPRSSQRGCVPLETLPLLSPLISRMPKVRKSSTCGLMRGKSGSGSSISGMLRSRQGLPTIDRT